MSVASMPVAETSVEDTQDEDGDSLFGSPPPSPGRPASPSLALPSSGYSGSGIATSHTQNVGTIALPGSQPYSELPINPIALSLNYGIVQRPPAPKPTASSSSSSNAGPSSHSRNASVSSSKPKKKPKQSQPPPAKPAGPEFDLPDPSAPPPVHFLRNQQNLLGKAGMIAGVKPAALTHSRGSTPSNPILVDDEEDRPLIGRRARSCETSQPYIDPSLLTAPTNQEIVSVLIGQKDIFPILEGVLKLIMGNAPPTAQRRPGFTGFERNSGQRPIKKRKLNRVPAGAVDWDVPYPFEKGEGPEAYRDTWERERGKQLISQLIKLIKSAARKAATKKYLQEQKDTAQTQPNVQPKSQPKINGYYRPETIYGLDVLHDTSNTIPHTRNSIPTLSTEVDPKMAAAFDQLMTSLDNLPVPTPETSTVAATQSVPDGVDQPLFDTWMNFLESFPVNFDGRGTQSSTQCSTPAPDFDFSDLCGSSTASTSELDAIMASIFQDQPSAGSLDMNVSQTPSSAVGDHLIDPSLLALSMPSSSTNPGQNGVTNSHVLSPIASGSSSLGGSTNPGTPVSAGWELSMPDVFVGGSGEGQGQGWNNEAGLTDFGALPDELAGLLSGQDKGKGKEKQAESVSSTVSTSVAATATVPALNSTAGSVAGMSSQPLSWLCTAPMSVKPTAAARRLRQEDIVKRAQEQRKAIQAELDAVKMRLWGTTIEQAALVTLARKLETEPTRRAGAEGS